MLVVRDAADLPAAPLHEWAAPLPAPDGVLLCPPTHFDVVDVKNPHMTEWVGKADLELAGRQWTDLAAAFEELGLRVERVEPLPGSEDMVFCANQTFTGPDRDGQPLCMLSRMRHPSRRREVPQFAVWFAGHGWRVADPLGLGEAFEGGGDALWHPGRRLIWAGHGFRTRAAAHTVLAETFGAPVISLALADERYYHLDTALCPLDERSALLVPGALERDGEALVRRLFERVIEVAPDEAQTALAANAAAFADRGIVIDRRATGTAAALEESGYRVLRVDTGEFLKSGGSVFCMKQLLWAPLSG